MSHGDRRAKLVLSASLLLSVIAASGSSFISTGNWWYSVPFAFIAVTAIWRVWRKPFEISLSVPALRASLLVVIGLSLIAGVACIGIAPAWMLWSGLIAYAVAWCTYLGNLHTSVGPNQSISS